MEKTLRSSGRLVGLRDQRAQRGGQLLEAAAADVLKLEVEAAGGAEAADRRRIEGDGRLRDPEQPPAHALEYAFCLQLRRVSIHGLENGEQHAAVRRGGAGEEAVAADRDDAADAWRPRGSCLLPSITSLVRRAAAGGSGC